MNSLSATTTLLAHSLSWALLYSLWQGLLVYVTLYVILKALPNLNAKMKYYFSYAAFTTLVLWFADTWASQYQKLKGITVYITQSSADNSVAATYPVTITGHNGTEGSLLQHYIPHIEQYTPVIILLYIIGLSFMLFRFAVNIVSIRTLKNNGILLCSTQTTNFVSHWQQQLGIGRKVRVLISKQIDVPLTLGALKPIILLPVAMINHLTTEQTEAILLHELAHIKRHDYLLNIFQSVAETILFFNPFMWLISGIIRREREHCCDDLVVASAVSPLPYAKALAVLETSRINNNLALAANGHKNQLFNRIKRIMEMKKNTTNYSQLTILLVAVTAIIFSVAMFTFTPSFAQKAKKAQKENYGQNDSTRKKPMYKYKTVTVDSNGNTVTEDISGEPHKHDSKGKDDDVNINISVNSDDNDGDTKAKIIIKKRGEDGDEMNQVVKEISISTKDIADALASIDFKKMDKEVASAKAEVNAINWDEIYTEIRNSLAEANRELNSSEMQKHINIEIKKELEHTKKDLEHMKIELQKNKAVIAEASAGDHDSYSYSSSDDYEAMLKKMEKDGLINRSSKYKVEKEDDQLYINGERQPAHVYEKYSRYLKGNNIMIKGNKGTLTINVNN